MRPSRLVIVDDHALAREGLKAALSSEDYEIVAAFESGEALLDQIETLRADLILLDIRLGAGMDGLETARAITALNLSTKVMMLTLHDDADYVRAALEAGATGYVLKDAGLKDLREAVRQVLAGTTAIPASLLSTILARKESKPTDSQLIERLTPREMDVLEHVTEGLTNKAIARALSISPATVKAHVERVIAKLGVADRTQAAVMMTRWRETERLS